MNKKTKILVVDDDQFICELVEEVLGGSYQVIIAKDGYRAEQLAKSEQPDLILLDVEMPGMDGYETCAKFKQDDGLVNIPVIFVSAHDQIEERLKGYEVGGGDYVIKPFAPLELKAKIQHLLATISERVQLKENVSSATNMAMATMTSMSEMGLLLDSLKKFNASTDEKALAEAVLTGCSCYGLNGVTQIRTADKTFALSDRGEASPLEVSIIENMGKMDRIVHFKSKMSIHYPRATLLINNMPVEDPDRCGRLRDHLAMLVEGADMRAAGIIAEAESRRRGEAIEKAAISITKMLAEVDQAQRQSKITTSMAINDFTEAMEKAYIRVALSDTHERYMADIVKTGMDNIDHAQSAEIDIQNKLTGVIKELQSITGLKE